MGKLAEKDNLDIKESWEAEGNPETEEKEQDSAKPEAGEENRENRTDWGAGEAQDGKEETPEESEEEPESGQDPAQEKRSFKKKAKADKKQETLKETISELEDRVKRQMAEFDNFRKRSEKEKTAMFETGAKSVIEKILPVVDNFERGLATVPEEEKEGGFAEGMRMIYRQLMTELDSLGVKPIEAVGKEFDPEYHNAVMQVESEEYGSGIVAQELQKGYMYRDSVVRHSMVAVVS